MQQIDQSSGSTSTAADLLKAFGGISSTTPSNISSESSVSKPNYGFSSIKLPYNNSGPKLSKGQVLNAERINRLAGRFQDRHTANRFSAEDMELNARAKDLTRQITRRWRPGDIYAPKDLSSVEAAKWKKRSKPDRDVFDVLGFDPIANYHNFSIMSEYMTPMGRIKHGNETGLRPVNQRKIAKAIRRVIGMGLMPSVHVHPELLQKSAVRNSPLSASSRAPF